MVEDATADDVNDTLDEFLSVEQKLKVTATVGTYDSGVIEDLSRQSVDQLPDGYPLDIVTPEVLRVDVAVDDDTTVVTYLEWLGFGEDDDHIYQLIDAVGLSKDTSADLVGQEVGLSKKDGWHYVDFSRTELLHAPQDVRWNTSPWWLVVLVGLAGAVTWTLPQASAPMSDGMLYVTSAAVAGLAIYADGTTLKRVVPWPKSTRFWALLAVLPVVNVTTILAYLMERYAWLREQPMGRSNVWRAGIFAGFGMQILPMVDHQFGLFFLVGHGLIMCAVYFDSYHRMLADGEKIVDGEYNYLPGAALFWLFAVLFTGIVGAILYLLLAGRDE